MVDVHYLQFAESPPANDSWLVIVKTADRDYEIVASLRDASHPTTVATAHAFESALELARRAAYEFELSAIYVLGSSPI